MRSHALDVLEEGVEETAGAVEPGKQHQKGASVHPQRVTPRIATSISLAERRLRAYAGHPHEEPMKEKTPKHERNLSALVDGHRELLLATL